jgi:hypothetical protein
MGNKFDFDEPETTGKSIPLVRDLFEALRNYKVKLAAAFARIRIERKAEGNNAEEQMENILPPETRRRESFASK